jgi:hypothetical protein
MTTHLRRIALVAGAAAIVVVAAWYLMLWSPQSRSLASAHKAHAAAESQIGQLQGQVGGLEALVRQIPTDQAKLSTYSAAVPATPSLDSALVQIQRAATASRVSVSSVSPGSAAGTATGVTASSATPATSGTPSLSLSLAVMAPSAGQLESFITDLTNLALTPRVFVLDHVQYSGPGQTSASLSGRIFYAGKPTP